MTPLPTSADKAQTAAWMEIGNVRRWCALYVTFYTVMIAVDLLIGHRSNYVACFVVSFNFASVITALWPRRKPLSLKPEGKSADPIQHARNLGEL